MRAIADVPILIGTRIESEIDAVLAFELGVAGYLTDPSRTRELIARVRAALRTTYSPGTLNDSRPGLRDAVTHVVGPLEVDLVGRGVKLRGRTVNLARREFDLLSALLTPPGVVRTRQELVDQVWRGRDLEGSRTLDTHIRRLRLKLELDPARPRLLITVRGVGFRVEAGSPARS